MKIGATLSNPLASSTEALEAHMHPFRKWGWASDQGPLPMVSGNNQTPSKWKVCADLFWTCVTLWRSNRISNELFIYSFICRCEEEEEHWWWWRKWVILNIFYVFTVGEAVRSTDAWNLLLLLVLQSMKKSWKSSLEGSKLWLLPLILKIRFLGGKKK